MGESSRTTTNVIGGKLAKSRKCKIKCGALIHLAFGPEPAAMPLDNPLRKGQSNSCSSEFLQSVEPLKEPEESGGGGILETDSIIPHKIRIQLESSLSANFDLRCGAGPSEFDRIGQQDAEHLPH